MEIDGAAHETSQRFAEDLLRHDDLALSGERILRFAALTIRTEPAAVVRRMRQAHAQWGRAA
jgi:very-short-patch-repair endonuclease